MKERKHSTVKGMIIAEVTNDDKTITYSVYTKDEFSYGKGFRTPEFEGCEINEAICQAKHF